MTRRSNPNAMVERIADSLTPAQQGALLNASGGADGAVYYGVYRDRGALVASMVAKKLGFASPRGTKLNTMALKVRFLLQERKGRDNG